MVWPGLWNQPLQHQQISQWIRGKKLAYQGTLQVWYISANASGTGDGSSWAKARLSKFEKNNFGIFYEMQIMDTEKLQEKISQGQRPDLIFFGHGQWDIVQPLLRESTQSAHLVPCFQPEEESSTAWPVFYGGYAILINEQALYTVGLSPPLDAEEIDETLIQQAKQALPHAFAYETQQAAMAVMQSSVNEGTKQSFVEADVGTRAQFIQEEIAFFVCPASTWYTIEGMSNTQSIPSYQAIPLSNSAIEIQYVGSVQTEDEEKAKACDAAIAYLLNQNSQQALENIGAMPVLQTNDSMQAQGAITGALWQHREEDKLCVFSQEVKTEDFFAVLKKEGFSAAEQWLKAACNTP